MQCTWDQFFNASFSERRSRAFSASAVNPKSRLEATTAELERLFFVELAYTGAYEIGTFRPVLYRCRSAAGFAIRARTKPFRRLCNQRLETLTRPSRHFWAADSPAEAERIADEVAKTGVPFDEALRRLKLGRTYTAQQTGIIQLENRTGDGIEHFYALNIPSTYDPTRRYQVRFQLHGGVTRRTDAKPQEQTSDIGALAGAEQIYVLPNAWTDEPWWHDDQVLDLNAILDTLKRAYNIDENRVVLSGVSDGGTGK